MREPTTLARSPVGGMPWGEAIHATAVAVAGFGLLILGPSGSGKSRLALALIAADPRRIRLIGDDRVLLASRETGLVARPHPRIAGFIERRGLGIVACPFIDAAVVRGVVRLDPATDGHDVRSKTLSAGLTQNFSNLPVVTISGAQHPAAQRDAVLSWWRDACTTPIAKTPRNGWPAQKFRIGRIETLIYRPAERFGARQKSSALETMSDPHRCDRARRPTPRSATVEG